MQRFDMTCLGIADMGEWGDHTEITDHLVINGPSMVFVVECLMQRMDFLVVKC